VALGGVIAASIFRAWILRLRGPLTMERRARWMQQSCRASLRAAGIHCRVEGAPPAHGLVVSNHLSYLDILILAAAMPCFFVAKIEIGRWPFFGHAARLGGTLFIDRSSRASAVRVAKQMSDRLKLPLPVLLFPEGTSTDGSQLLPFHSGLFQPSITAGAPVTAAAVCYTMDDGTPERELCWVGDALFVPHLAKMLGVGGFTATVSFGEPRVYTDRRAAAVQTHNEIAAMRAQMQQNQCI
jgi:1-acyl-sn-glycerol-3-phosphate acyltransferase